MKVLHREDPGIHILSWQDLHTARQGYRRACDIFCYLLCMCCKQLGGTCLNQASLRVDDFDEGALEQLVAVEGKVVYKPGDAGCQDAAAEVAEQHCHLAPAIARCLAYSICVCHGQLTSSAYQCQLVRRQMPHRLVGNLSGDSSDDRSEWSTAVTLQ